MAYRHPLVFQEANFKMIADLYVLLFKVASERHPMMAEVGYVHMDTGEKQAMLSVWVGIGANASPLNRVSELFEENERLKMLLKDLSTKQPAEQ